MVTTGPRRSAWREKWAQAENARRTRVQHAAMAAWQQWSATYQQWLAVASGFRPAAGDVSPPPIVLTRGETVYWSGDGVGMIESPYPPPLPVPDYRLDPAAVSGSSSVARGAAASAGAPVRWADSGSLVVTSKRVVFTGARRREWSYAKLTGLEHLPGGQTLMLVSNRKQVSGVAIPSAAASDFRLRLAIAMADAAGDRDGLVSFLEEVADRHEQDRPPPPPPVAAGQAPVSAWFTGVRLAATIAASSLLVLICCGSAAAMTAGDEADPSPSATETADPEERVSPPRTAGGTGRRSPSPPATATREPSTPAAPNTAPESGGPRPAPGAGDCAAYVDSDDWCVDGIGDYDCEGGTGNGPNYAPRGVRLVDPAVDPFGLDRDGDGEGCEDARPAPPPPAPPPAPDTDPRFGTCAEAKANGYGPYYRGQDPEYSWYRDADSDGVVCE